MAVQPLAEQVGIIGAVGETPRKVTARRVVEDIGRRGAAGGEIDIARVDKAVAEHDDLVGVRHGGGGGRGASSERDNSGGGEDFVEWHRSTPKTLLFRG